jgi:hypothetical protein
MTTTGTRSTEDHAALVAEDGGGAGPGNLVVGDGRLGLHGIDDASQSRAEDQAELRLNRGTAADERSGFFDRFQHGSGVYED